MQPVIIIRPVERLLTFYRT